MVCMYVFVCDSIYNWVSFWDTVLNLDHHNCTALNIIWCSFELECSTWNDCAFLIMLSSLFRKFLFFFQRQSTNDGRCTALVCTIISHIASVSRPHVLMHRWLIPIALSVACCIVYYGQKVQNRPTLCIEVEEHCSADISIGIIFDSPP